MIDDILKARNSVHGDFSENAIIHQDLLSILVRSTSYHELDAVKVTALQYICGKISRIVSGDPEYKDHWDDIAGYALLVSERITK